MIFNIFIGTFHVFPDPSAGTSDGDVREGREASGVGGGGVTVDGVVFNEP